MCRGMVIKCRLTSQHHDANIAGLAGKEVEIETKKWETVPGSGRLFTVRPIGKPKHPGVKIVDDYLKVKPDGMSYQLTLSDFSDKYIKRMP